MTDRGGSRAVSGVGTLALSLVIGLVVALSMVPTEAAVAQGGLSDAGRVVAGGNGPGPGPAQLFRPEALVVDASGRALIADTFNNRVVQWDRGAPTGVTVIAGGAGGLGPYPGGVARDGLGRVFVSDTFNHRVVRLVPGSPSITVVAGGLGTGDSNAGSGLDRLNTPSKVSVDASGRLFVVDTANDRVVRWDPGASAGVVVAGGRGRGAGPDQLSLPVGMALDTTGSVYVADTYNHRIVRWDPAASSGVVVAGGNGAGVGVSQLNQPVGVDVDDAGGVVVADTQNHRAVRWADGAAVGVVVAGGSRGGGLTQLDTPADVDVSADGAISVADRGNHRVIRFAALVEVLATPETARLLASLATVVDITVVKVTGDSGTAGGPGTAGGGATFVVTGCPGVASPLPGARQDYLDMMAGDSYLDTRGLSAAPVSPACRPAVLSALRDP